MGTLERVLHAIALGFEAVVLTGLVTRKLYRLCYSFAGYMAAVLTAETMIFLWPARFFTWYFWLTKETTYAALKLAIALEIAALAYQAFPAARRAVGRLILAALLLVLAMLTIGVNYGADFPTLARELLRRVANGTAYVFLAVWGLVLWYRLPLHRLHRAILRGLVPYLLIFTGARSLTLAFGWDIRRPVNQADAVCYVVMLAYWAWEVWRRPPSEPEFFTELQPWRARL
jgi:hypothetical protein